MSFFLTHKRLYPYLKSDGVFKQMLAKYDFREAVNIQCRILNNQFSSNFIGKEGLGGNGKR